MDDKYDYDQKDLQNQIDVIFKQYDYNKSGRLNINELHGFLN